MGCVRLQDAWPGLGVHLSLSCSDRRFSESYTAVANLKRSGPQSLFLASLGRTLTPHPSLWALSPPAATMTPRTRRQSHTWKPPGAGSQLPQVAGVPLGDLAFLF